MRQQLADGPLIKTNSLELIFSSINDCLLKLTSRVDTVEQVIDLTASFRLESPHRFQINTQLNSHSESLTL